MAYIKLINGTEHIYIPCEGLPLPGETGVLQLTCRRDREPGPNGREYIAIQCEKHPGANPPPYTADMTIQLQEPIDTNQNLVLPYNGGVPWFEISIKEDH